MREILFRGKRNDNGEWVEGYYFERKDTQGNIIESVIIDDAYEQIRAGQRYVGSKLNKECFRVDSKTVGQFTGLVDMDGKKIFEGDVIKSDNGRRSSISVVKLGQYYPKMFYNLIKMYKGLKPKLPCVGFFAKSIKNGEHMILIQNSFTTVLGNIYDNPELLGGGG